MLIQQISVFMENKPGSFVNLAEILSTNGINMRAMSVADTADFGILRMIVNDPEKTKAVLAKEQYIFNETSVVAVEVEDRPGSLMRILNILGEAEINLEYMYAFLSPKGDGAYMVFRVDDPDRAVTLLTAAGIGIVKQNELYQL